MIWVIARVGRPTLANSRFQPNSFQNARWKAAKPKLCTAQSSRGTSRCMRVAGRAAMVQVAGQAARQDGGSRPAVLRQRSGAAVRVRPGLVVVAGGAQF